MIYLDHAATTPLDRDVLTAMLPYLQESFGNASSQHALGRKTAEAVMQARDTIAEIVGCRADEVYFTSCATEADNWALKGVCLAERQKGNHMVLSSIEHPALIQSALDMQKQGWQVTFVDPDPDGRVSARAMKEAIRKDTVFVSLMAANNETGVRQPIEEVGDVCREKGIFFFSDCVQAAGVLPLPWQHCTALSFSAHKFYGPKGVGVLLLKKGAHVERLLSGGRQERGLRGGTTNTPAVVGCAKALALAYEKAEENARRVARLRDTFVERVLTEIAGTSLNGDLSHSLPAHANLSFEGCDGENILFLLDLQGIAVSTGSACSSGAVTPSRVLTAMGRTREQARSAVRFSFGKNNTDEEIDRTIVVLKQVVDKIRRGK